MKCLFFLFISSVDTHIDVEPDSIKVREGRRIWSITIPGLILQPETCRGLKILKEEELHFSVKGTHVN